MAKFADKVPLMVCAAVLVMKSELLAPVSAENAALATVTVGAVVSTVTASEDEATDVLPAASVAVAVRGWLPWLNADEVMLQLPEPSAVAVPSNVVPLVSYSFTVLLASAVPVKTGVVLLVMLSVLDAPVSVTLVMSGALGANGGVVSPTGSPITILLMTMYMPLPDCGVILISSTF